MAIVAVIDPQKDLPEIDNMLPLKPDRRTMERFSNPLHKFRLALLLGFRYCCVEPVKINQGKYSEPGYQFNEVYDAFEIFFNRIFEQRRVYSEHGANAGYVSVPEIEKRLNNFVSSGSSEICLFVGSIGIGKSSVLRHLNAHQWGDQDGIETIFLDLNRRKAALEQVRLPDDFPLLEEAEQKRIVNENISSYVASEIESHLAGILDFESEAENLFEFFWENNRELLMPNGMFKPLLVEGMIYLLQLVHQEKRVPFLFVVLKYYALTRNLRGLVLVVDNCDQKDPLLIEAFIDTLCHLDHCFENIRGAYDILPKLTSIVSCRPATRLLLEEGAARNALGSHGAKVIPMDCPCSLAELVKERIANAGTHGETQTRITSRNGIVWEFPRRSEFLHRLVESIESNHNGSLILSLCNWNVADGLLALCEIIRNQHFADFDRVIGDLAIDESVGDTGFSRANILRSLSYGNPTGDPIYPVRGTRVPNLISGKGAEFPETFLRPRLIQLLVSQGGHSNGHYHSTDLLNIAEEFFACPEEEAARALDQLFTAGLLETKRGYPPSVHNGGCEIFATPRAKCLWAEMNESDLLLGFYRDDVSLSERHKWRRVPTYRLSLDQRCIELIRLCQDAVEGELEEFRRIASRAKGEEFLTLFENSFISERLINGVGVAIYTFYRKIVRDWDRLKEAEEEFQKLPGILSSGRQEILRGQVQI